MLDLQGQLRLPSEQDLQAPPVTGAPRMRAAGSCHAVAHLPVTGAVLLRLPVVRRRPYLWPRRSPTAATGAAPVGHVRRPVAPPRQVA